MERSRAVRPEEATADLESRLSALRVIAGGGATQDVFDRDDEIRRRALEFLAAAKHRIAAAEQRASETEAMRRQLEIDLGAQIEHLEAQTRLLEESNARLTSAKDLAEERAARAEARADAANDFLGRLNQSLRDLAG